MATRQQKSDHVTKVRQAVTDLMSAINKLRILKTKYDAQGLAADLAVDDCVGENEGILPQDIAGVYVALQVIDETLETGIEENLLAVVMS